MDSSGDDSTGPSARRLSYKFQRLRERIRAAIAAGELAGKLPGERSLARQFNVNAKTLSKALTDLAAEGVLERNIGLGTFVRDGTSPTSQVKVLLLADAITADGLRAALAERNVEPHVHTPTGDLPPSLVAPFDVVLVASRNVSEDSVRDLIVRGKSVIMLDRMTRPYSTHSLMPNTDAAATLVAMELVTLGHKRLLLIPDDPDGTAEAGVARAVPTAEVRPVALPDLAAAARDGFTAAMVPGYAAARAVADCRQAGLKIPGAFSVMGYGRVTSPPSCGQFVTDAMYAAAIADLLGGGLPHKPVTLWISPAKTFLDTAGPKGDTSSATE